MKNSLARLKCPLASFLIVDQPSTYSFVAVLVAPNDLDEFCLYNLIAIVVVGGKLADVEVVTPDRDCLSNAMVDTITL